MAILTIKNSSCVIPPIKYGLLYNGYTVRDSRKISSSDSWWIPTELEIDSLISFVENSFIPLKYEGLEYWNTNNGTNIYEFNAKGAGARTSNFQGIKSNLYLYSSTIQSSGRQIAYRFYDNGTVEKYTGTYGALVVDTGTSIRLVANATGISDGTNTIYEGNDGKSYKAVAINELYWITENLTETKYRNGDIIPEVTDNTEWTNLTTGALCAYNNNWNNV